MPNESKKVESITLAAALLFCYKFNTRNSWFDILNEVFEYLKVDACYVRKTGDRFSLEGNESGKAGKVVDLITKRLEHPDHINDGTASIMIVSVTSFLEELRGLPEAIPKEK